MCDKYVLGAAVGCITRELAERTLGFSSSRQNLSFDDDFRSRRDLDVVYPTTRDPVGLAEQASDDLEFPHMRWIGVDH